MIKRPLAAIVCCWLLGLVLYGAGSIAAYIVLILFIFSLILIFVFYVLFRKSDDQRKSGLLFQIIMPFVVTLAFMHMYIATERLNGYMDEFNSLCSNASKKGVVITGTLYDCVTGKNSDRLYIKDICIFSGVTNGSTGQGKAAEGLSSNTAQNQTVKGWGGRCLVYYADGSDFNIGERLQLTISPIEITGRTNEGGFDRREYFMSEGITGAGYALKVVKDASYDAGTYRKQGKWYVSLLNNAEDKFYVIYDKIVKLRRKLTFAYYRMFDEENAGTLSAMTLGESGLLEAETKEMYKENGIAHILAVSGLHMSLLGMGFYRLLRKIYVPNGMASAVGIIFMSGYLLLAGSPVSLLRAAIVSMLALCAKLLGRLPDRKTLLSAAAFAITLFNPLAVKSSSFILSFSAIFAICIGEDLKNHDEEQYVRLICRYWKTKEGRGKYFERYADRIFSFYEMIKSSLIIQFFTMPVLAYFFYEITPFSMLANFIVLPLMSFILILGPTAAVFDIFSTTACGVNAASAVSVFAGSSFASAASAIAGILEMILKMLTEGILGIIEIVCTLEEKLPFSLVLTGRPRLGGIVLYYVFILAVFLYVKWRKKRLFSKEIIFINGDFYRKIQVYVKYKIRLVIKTFCAVLAALCLLLLFPCEKQTGVRFLDVGQGDCTVAEDIYGQIYVFDCGSTDKEVYEYVLKPFMKENRKYYIDYVFVTHTDKDHCSGITELLESMQDFDGIGKSSKAATQSEKDSCISRYNIYSRYDGEMVILNLILPDVSEKDERFMQLEQLAMEKGVQVRYFSAGNVVLNDSMCIRCIYPEKSELTSSDNDTSLVFMTEDMKLGYMLLVTGDIGAEAEAKIIKREKLQAYKEFTGLKLLKAGHHGSKYSSSEAFLEYCDADISVISVGKGNPYGHPSEEAVERLNEAGCRILRTDRAGEVFIIPGKDIKAWNFDSMK